MIRLNNIGMTFPDGTVALTEVSTTLEDGTITALLGTSGAGKSTLLRTLNHLCQPTTGTVEIAGLGILSTGSKLRQHRSRTGMIFQLHHLHMSRSSLDNVLMGRLGRVGNWKSLWPAPSEEVDFAYACLERVGIGEKALQRADELSGGQRQRVGIARALFMRPTLILADEPVASLDPATSMRVLELITDICREDGLTAVISLHQVDLARKFSDHILALQTGRVLFDGPTHNFTTEIEHRLYGLPLPAAATFSSQPDPALAVLAAGKTH